MTTQTISKFPSPAAVGGFTIECHTCGWKINGISEPKSRGLMGKHECSPLRLLARRAPIVKGWV